MRMSSRGPAWAGIFLRSLARRAAGGRRLKPLRPARIVVVHHLLLGDTILLTPLLAKLRRVYPDARIDMTCPSSMAPLYSGKPYGIEVLAYDLRDRGSVANLLSRSGYDLAVVPGDNRFSWLAQAMGARWIRAFRGDRPPYKNWPVDEYVEYSKTPATLADMTAALVDGPLPEPFGAGQWPAPAYRRFEAPTGRYCVLHVGARSPLRLWDSARWRSLAEFLARKGLEVVLTAGKGEEAVVRDVDPDGRYRAFAAALDLAQLWHLLRGATLLVCPDTGIAHLAKIARVPTVALFGPGSAVVFGKGDFWRHADFAAVTIADFPCRDQRNLFKRRIEWMRHCARTLDECPHARCLDALDIEMVKMEVDSMLARATRSTGAYAERAQP